jgi:hypothetical protein
VTTYSDFGEPDQNDIPAVCRFRFRLAEDAESESRADRRDDIRFVRLREQWPSYAVRGRNQPGRERPMLVDNRLMAYRNQVINEIRQNTPSIKVRPADDSADVKTAEILDGCIRHIMAVSGGDIAIDTAAEWQVDCGIGYILVEPDWADGESFDQELYVRRVAEPDRWWIDPRPTDVDGSGLEWAISCFDTPKDEFKRQYPHAKAISTTILDYGSYDGWITKETVRIAKYYWIKKEPYKAQNPYTGQSVTRYRKTVWCSLVAGDEELERTEILFSNGDAWIPLIPVYGLDTYIEGKRYIEGLIRNAKDPQRLLNYVESAKAEHAALVTKSPWIGTAEQFEGRPEWDDPNTPYAKMVYNATSHMGQPLPPPQRGASPSPDTAWVQMEQQAILSIQACLGIYEGALGNNPNDQSGRALQSIQRQQSQGTFHFSDNLSRSIRHLGRILVSMIPRYYSREMVARIIGEDGTQDSARIDPNMPQSVNEYRDENGAIQRIYNLGVGRYDVVCDVGPSYATRRQESVETALELLKTPLGQGVAMSGGDLVIKQLDMPLSQDLAERYQKGMDPKFTADENAAQSPEMMQAQQQMQQMAQQMEQMSAMFQDLKTEHDIKMQELQIKAYEAETHRIAATKETPEEGPGIKEELEYTRAHADHELQERRLALDYLKAERDYKLELMRLGLDAQQAEAAEEMGEEEEMDEATQFADTDTKTEE